MENNFLPKIFVENKDHTISSQNLSDEEYAKAISNLIVVCGDVLFINKTNKSVYLAKRISKPMQGLWLIGGRRKAGESPLLGITRKLKQETGLDIESSRFEFLTIVEYLWEDRQQEPQNTGTHGLAYTYAIELSEEEIKNAAVNLDADEYDKAFGLKEFSKQDLLDHKAHPALLYFFDLALK